MQPAQQGMQVLLTGLGFGESPRWHEGRLWFSKSLARKLTAFNLAAGGTTYNEPRDYGFMYQHAYQDFDGHHWELIWLDPNTGQQS